MKTWLKCMGSLCTMIVLLGSAAPLTAAASAAGPHLMPPHPRLLEEYEAGRLSLPAFVAHPDLGRATGIDSPAGPAPLLGSLKALAVVVDFSDQHKTVTASFFDTLIFAAPAAGRGSVYDYFDEVSYGQIDIVTLNLPSSLGWIRADETAKYYTDYDYPFDDEGYCTDEAYPHNCQKLAEDIVDAVDSAVNFDNYDNDNNGYAEPIMIIHAGPGAEFTGDRRDIWSHSWELANPRTYDGVTIRDYVIMPEYWEDVWSDTSDMTIGVFAHEMGHGFWGLPDLHDRDYPNIPSVISKGVGDWSLMASGSWNGYVHGDGYTYGESPAWPDAWSRVHMGILAPTTISGNVSGRSIPQAYNNPSPAQTVLKLDSEVFGAQEYYLLENRQQIAGAYDEYLPGEGLLIWHVDEWMWDIGLQNDEECILQPNYTCSDAAHYMVRLVQADGVLDLEFGGNAGNAGDAFPGSMVNRSFTMRTDPESSSYYSSVPTCIGVTAISDAGSAMTANLQVQCAKVYSPLIARNYVYTFYPLLNGNFESGHTGWGEYDSVNPGPVVISQPEGPSPPHSGTWIAWLGGLDEQQVSRIWQTVTVYHGTPYLGFWYWISSDEGCGYDWGYVRVDSAVVRTIPACDTGGWVHEVVNLSGWADKTVNLQFELVKSSWASWWIDDVAFQPFP